MAERRNGRCSGLIANVLESVGIGPGFGGLAKGGKCRAKARSCRGGGSGGMLGDIGR